MKENYENALIKRNDMVCYDLLVDIKLREFCHNCKYFSLCGSEPGYCDYCIGRIAKELGMKFMDVAGHVRSKVILVTK